jgi:hypothetical protein
LLKIASAKLLVEADKKCTKVAGIYGFYQTKKEVLKAVVKGIA